MLPRMMSTKESDVNRARLNRSREVLGLAAEQLLRKQAHGVVRVELTIADGTIQRISHAVEQFER